MDNLKQIKELEAKRDLLIDQIKQKMFFEIGKVTIEYNKKIKSICNTEAMENTEFKIGDFIGNVTGIIQIDKIEGNYCKFWGFQIKYSGLRYKKLKGEYLRTKDKSIRSFFSHPSLKLYKNAE